MKGRLFVLFIIILFLSFSVNSDEYRILSGDIHYKGNQKAPIQIRLYKRDVSPQGKVQPLSKREIYGAKKPFKEITLDQPSAYEFSQLPSGHYSVVAYMDLDKDHQLDFQPGNHGDGMPPNPGHGILRWTSPKRINQTWTAFSALPLFFLKRISKKSTER